MSRLDGAVAVIASEATRSRGTQGARRFLDCFVAIARRMTGVFNALWLLAMIIPPEMRHALASDLLGPRFSRLALDRDNFENTNKPLKAWFRVAHLMLVQREGHERPPNLTYGLGKLQDCLAHMP
jgi:hypothetical protein